MCSKKWHLRCKRPMDEWPGVSKGLQGERRLAWTSPSGPEPSSVAGGWSPGSIQVSTVTKRWQLFPHPEMMFGTSCMTSGSMAL